MEPVYSEEKSRSLLLFTGKEPPRIVFSSYLFRILIVKENFYDITFHIKYI